MTDWDKGNVYYADLLAGDPSKAASMAAAKNTEKKYLDFLGHFRIEDAFVYRHVPSAHMCIILYYN